MKRAVVGGRPATGGDAGRADGFGRGWGTQGCVARGLGRFWGRAGGCGDCFGAMREGSWRRCCVVTDRDRSVVAWVAVIGAVSVVDVMARFGVGRTVAYRRLRALVDYGLLRARAPRVRAADAVRRRRARARVGRDGAGGAGARGRRDGQALGAVRAAGCRARARGALRGVGGAAAARRRARGGRADRQRAARRPAGRPAAVAAPGPGAVSRCLRCRSRSRWSCR